MGGRSECPADAGRGQRQWPSRASWGLEMGIATLDEASIAENPTRSDRSVPLVGEGASCPSGAWTGYPRAEKRSGGDGRAQFDVDGWWVEQGVVDEAAVDG